MADFGVAVAMESAGLGRLTETGLSLGTPGYMSPEQASAERHLGPASDVYALGVVLYEMVAGEPPFTGKTAQAVIAKVMTETPVPVRSRRATVPPRIEAALMRALEKTPADRFASAAEFAAALQPNDPTSVTNQSSRPAERQIGPSWLPWVLVAVLASVVGILGWRSSLASRASDAAGGGHPPCPPNPSWNLGARLAGRHCRKRSGPSGCIRRDRHNRPHPTLLEAVRGARCDPGAPVS